MGVAAGSSSNGRHNTKRPDLGRSTFVLLASSRRHASTAVWNFVVPCHRVVFLPSLAISGLASAEPTCAPGRGGLAWTGRPALCRVPASAQFVFLLRPDGPIRRIARWGFARAFWISNNTQPPSWRGQRSLSAFALLFIASWTVVGPVSYHEAYRIVGLPLTIASAAILIVAGYSDPKSPVVKILSSKPFTAVGLVSYSLYLWHAFPIFLLKNGWMGLPSPLLGLLGITLAGLLTLVATLRWNAPSAGRVGTKFWSIAESDRTRTTTFPPTFSGNKSNCAHFLVVRPSPEHATCRCADADRRFRSRGAAIGRCGTLLRSQARARRRDDFGRLAKARAQCLHRAHRRFAR